MSDPYKRHEKILHRPMGFEHSLAEPDKIHEIIVRPRMAFRPFRLHVPSGIGIWFVITDVQVDDKSLMIGPHPISCAAFSMPEGAPFESETILIGQKISMFIRNLNPGPARLDFRAVLHGATVR